MVYFMVFQLVIKYKNILDLIMSGQQSPAGK
nr:MAG TPA: hypothetical protein [Caudoviricetes sp.]